MSEEPQYTFKHFVWRELMTPDVAAAKGFYGELLGWQFMSMPMPDGEYTVIKLGEAFLGGMVASPPGAPAAWLSYVSVPDVDAAAKAVEANGGKIVAPPMDIQPGRMAVVADPEGAHFTLWRSHSGDAPVKTPGPATFCWETLTTPDAAASKAFYAAVVGWDVQIGPAGPDSVVFAAGEHPVADVQQTEAHPPHWLTYVVAGPLDEMREKAEGLGAQIVVPRIEVPKVGNIALIADPTGAFIGLFEPQMQIA